MSGVAARVDPRLGLPEGGGEAAATRRVDRNVAGLLRLAAFLGLAVFGTGHWLSVLEGPPTGRGLSVVGVCMLGAAALWATGTLERPSRIAVAARPLIVVAMAVTALLVAGLPARYLLPHHWGAFGRGLNHGLLGAQSTFYPYTGGDDWVRLTLMLALPLFLVPAAALGFWPARRHEGKLRMAALVLLIGLYGMALAERTPNGQVGRGVVLMLLIAAWLWLPRLRAEDAATAGAVVAVAGIAALPIAAKLDSSAGWFDYRNWRIFSASGGITYSWDQSYGPITWPRRGTTLMFVKARRPYYWKAQSLDSFDGVRWIATDATNSSSSGAELPANPRPQWQTKIEVNVAALRGPLVVGAGTPFSVSTDAGDTQTSSDGTVTAFDQGLHSGEHYTVNTYIPEPSAAEMRSAPPPDGFFQRYTAFELPGPGGVPLSIDTGVRDLPGSAIPGVASSALLESPYAGMYGKALDLAAGERTTYDIVQSMLRFFQSDQFAYSERPPTSRYPLESFVTHDKVGYCQQFSGSMALMLRMLGIPARVVSGFAPGSPVPEAPGEYRVRDFDAHSWVEVYFGQIGWVTFDPTPSLSPASSQLDDKSPIGVVGGRSPRGLGQSQGPSPVGDAGGADAAGHGQGTLGLWILGVALAGVAGLVLAGLWLRAWLAHRRAQGDAGEAALRELRSALTRMGLVVVPVTTLAALERRLGTNAGPEAAHYTRVLRQNRYGPNGAPLPTGRERRALRRALARVGGPLGRLRALFALPPAPRLPR